MQSAQNQGGDAIKFEPFAPPSTAELDALIPGYQFLEFIDSGGMGAVYKAVQKSLNRTVAVKLLPQVHRNKATFAERFRREAEALARLNHPHIVAVYDFGETAEGHMYYTMEFVSGMDLQHLLKRDSPEPRQILQIITQVCEALQFAHERGIVHRDVKPANILIDERGNVKVADFGLAKVVGPQSADYTATGTTLGTPHYIAPEALDHDGKIDHRADIYSLGVMIYEIFTGHLPKGAWEPPSVCSGADKGIDVVVSKAMQSNPEKRYQHISDMTQVLEKLLRNSDNWKNFRRFPKSVATTPDEKLGRIPTDADTIQIQTRKPRALWPAKAAALLLLSALTAFGWRAVRPATSSGLVSASVPDVEQAQAAPEQVRLAEWVFAHEGFLNVSTPAIVEKGMGGNADVWQMDRLRNESFTVWRVCFAVSGLPIANEIDLKELVALLKAAGTVTNLNLRGLQVPATALSSLSSLSNLSHLDLTSSPVITREALPYLSSCKQLKWLRVSDSVDHALLAELRLLLPDCDIHDTGL
ncbi:serine/threonine-protein kinase [Prosthecobacter sp.]